MKKSELTKLIEALKDDDDIDETISKSDLGKALASSGLTLDAFKSKLESDPNFKSFMDSEKDKHLQKGIDTFKTNNLQKLVDEEYYKKHPDDKPKDPLVVQALEEAKKAKEEAAQLRKEKTHETLINKATKTLTDKGYSADFASHVVRGIEDENELDNTLQGFVKLLDVQHENDINLGLKGTYKPAGQGGTEPTEEAVKGQINSAFGLK